MKTRIIVDSTLDMTESFCRRARVIPLTIHFGQEVLTDGVTITRSQFYERLVSVEAMPTTSQPSPAAFEEAYEEIARAGESAVVITISSKLSGTCQSAQIAAEGYDNIYVVDSQNAANGSGHVWRSMPSSARKKAWRPRSWRPILKEKRNEICVIGVLDTLEYLKKGGRISKTVAFAGGVLNIKPVVTIEDGRVALIGKARGSRQGNNLLVKKIQEAGGVDFTMPILLGYTGLDDRLMQQYIQDSRELWQDGTERLDSVCIGSVIGTYAGPGAVVAAFFRKGGK